MSIFKRIFSIGSAEAHSALDKLEDPVKMTEQGIRSLKEDLNGSLKSLAEVKAVAIRARRDYEQTKSQAEEFEKKAMLLLQKGQRGEVDMGEAERLASECLGRKEQFLQQAATHQKLMTQQEAAVSKMEQNVQRLKSQIGQWENEAKTLKARAKVSEASKKINKQLSNIDSSSTVALLERMRDKVDQQEALAESYGSMADANTSIDDEISKALGPGTGGNSDALAALKAKMGMLNSGEGS